MAKHDKPRRRLGNPLFTLFRVILSLGLLAILFLFLYQAFINFSGYDPLKLNPRSVLQQISSTDTLYRFAQTLLTIDVRNPNLKGEISKVINQQSQPSNQPQGSQIFRFAVITDSHNDSGALWKALEQAKAEGVKFVIHLGDFTDVGSLQELEEAKRIMDSLGLAYYSTAGDHDLWDSRNQKLPAETNFTQVFGAPYASFSFDNVRFVIVYNADNYLGVDSIQRFWIEDELTKNAPSARATYIFSAIPFYHPSSDHIMGKTTPELKSQADDLLSLFSKFHVKGIFSGDTHYYSNYTDPKYNLNMYTIGASTTVRNPQAARFAIVDVYDAGDYTVQDLEIK